MVYIIIKHTLISRLSYHIIQIYSGITSGRVLDGELLYAEILEVNLYAFTYRLFGDCGFHSLVNRREIVMKQSVGKCK